MMAGTANVDQLLLTLAESEAQAIVRALAFTGGHIGAAARLLGTHRNTLARKMRKLGLRSSNGLRGSIPGAEPPDRAGRDRPLHQAATT